MQLSCCFRYSVRINGQEFSSVLDKPTGWFHVVVNYLGYNEGQGIKVYNNGVEVGNDTTINGGGGCQQSQCEPDGRIVVGRYYTRMNTPTVSLQVDQLAFFNEALSLDEITLLSQHSDNI